MRIAITGGSGALGRQLIADFLAAGVRTIRILSRDEHKHVALEEQFGKDRVRCFVADVRDPQRLTDIFFGCEIVIHAAALKRVDGTPYNLEEHRKTNIQGTVNVLRAARDADVSRLLTVSSDKVCAPANAYGCSKMWAELETTHFNAQSMPRGMRASCVRYGNVFASTGSVIELWRRALACGERLRLTDPAMTRFHITLPQASAFIRQALTRMLGGEIFVPKLPSYRLTDVLEAIAPGHDPVIIGRRPGGEKLAEQLLGEEECMRTLDDGWAYVVTPPIRTWSEEPYPGAPISTDWCYRSDRNDRWMTVEDLRALLVAHGTMTESDLLVGKPTGA